MAERRLRDLAELTARLGPWSTRHRGGRCEVEVRRPTSGWSNETLLVDVNDAAGHAELVVRLPSLIPALPDNDPEHEAGVLQLLRAHGLPAPEVVWVERDPAWLGVPFLVMERIAGRAVGEAPGLDPWLMGADEDRQRHVQDQFVDVLAGIHSIGTGDDVPSTLRQGLGMELDYWDAYVEWAADGSPSRQIRDLLAWCRDRAPVPSHPQALLWGDPRLGNLLYDENDYRLTGVLDWELASLGPPEMDLAWYVQMEELTTRVVHAFPPGFHTTESLLESYAKVSKRTVTDMGWHMVFALVRAGAINDREARIAQRTGEYFPGVYGEGHPLLRRAERLIESFEY